MSLWVYARISIYTHTYLFLYKGCFGRGVELKTQITINEMGNFRFYAIIYHIGRLLGTDTVNWKVEALAYSVHCIL